MGDCRRARPASLDTPGAHIMAGGQGGSWSGWAGAKDAGAKDVSAHVRAGGGGSRSLTGAIPTLWMPAVSV